MNTLVSGNMFDSFLHSNIGLFNRLQEFMKVKCKENPFPLFAQNDNFQLKCIVRFLNFSLPSGSATKKLILQQLIKN